MDEQGMKMNEWN